MFSPKSFRNIFVIALGILQLAVLCANAEKIQPNAWGIARSKEKERAAAARVLDTSSEHVCPEVKCACDDDSAATYYNKLVKSLFRRRSTRMVEDFDGKHLISIHLQISEQHLKAIFETEDVRDLDAIVSSVLENSRDGLLVVAKEAFLSWFERLEYAYLYVINSHTVLLFSLTLLFVISVLTLRYLCNLNLIACVVVNLLCASLFFKYLECNRRLEFDNIEKMKSFGSAANPCEHTTSFFGLISNYNAHKCTEYMMSIHNHDRQMCDPIEIISDFSLTLFMKPLGKLMEMVEKHVDTTFSKHGYIKGAIFSVIVLAFLRYLLPILMRGFSAMIPSYFSSPAKPELVTKEVPQSPVINVQINLDPKAIGDYVQQVRQDEEKSRGAICMTPNPESPMKGNPIENIGDGSEVNSNLIKGGDSEEKAVLDQQIHDEVELLEDKKQK